MCDQGPYLGCQSSLDDLRVLNDRLNSKVVEQINDNQELVMLNGFAHESNEFQFKRCLQDRISDIGSWRWVLEDLTKRLNEAIRTLRYEHNAVEVVISRVKEEIDITVRDGSKPGILCPLTDSVEEAIMQEYHFLLEQKNKFRKLLTELSSHIEAMEKTKKKIEADILNKQQTIMIEEACANITSGLPERLYPRSKKKKRGSLVIRWENRCISLKRAGLRALTDATIVRQQVRGARVHLSIAAQAYAARIDSALRRRLHSNKVKLQDLQWQKDEVLQDYKSLTEELTVTEQNILENMEEERIIEARLVDRTMRPVGEITRDEVDKKLRDELGRIRNFSKQLRTNHDRITELQHSLTDSIVRTNCCAEDILQVIRLDEERITARLGIESNEPPPNPPPIPSLSDRNLKETSPIHNREGLQSISEEEEDDYPFQN